MLASWTSGVPGNFTSGTTAVSSLKPPARASHGAATATRYVVARLGVERDAGDAGRVGHLAAEVVHLRPVLGEDGDDRVDASRHRRDAPRSGRSRTA